MITINLTVIITLLCCLVSVASQRQVFGKHESRDTFVQKELASLSVSHELVFALKQHNLDQLHEILQNRSTPGSSMYQKWLSFEEIGTLTSNREGAAQVVQWLEGNNVTVSWISVHHDYIKARAPISTWNSLLEAEFFVFEDQNAKVKVPSLVDVKSTTHYRHHRTRTFSVPNHIHPLLAAVFNTVQAPPILRTVRHKKKSVSDPAKRGPGFEFGSLRSAAKTTAATGAVTVGFLNELYKISSNHGSSKLQQAVFETSDEHFSPSDLASFQSNYGLPRQQALAPYGYSTSNCNKVDCYEGNLDVQYMMGIAQDTELVYWYVDSSQYENVFVAWAADASDMQDPPLVNSISWGSVEQVSLFLDQDSFCLLMRQFLFVWFVCWFV
jgi:subtilase family serine protease